MSESSDREILLEMRGDLKTVMSEVRKTNGRVTALEEWRHGQELAAAKAEGISIASHGVILTVKQLTVLAGIVGAVGTIAGFVSRYAGT